MNYWHPWQLKKIKVLGALLKYQLNSNANSAHLSCLAGSSKWTPRILIFSIVMGAKYLPFVKSIPILALTFFGTSFRSWPLCKMRQGGGPKNGKNIVTPCVNV